ncbi:MAG: TIGR03560 family F420-dependent LLM class oxidoreductase [Actinomycetota bacterium]|nr:TIGR03560 family F420-dependent LLM class oxidoreductase [Actinomycetota bacterium]
MRFGIDVSQHQLSWDELLRRTRHAEDAGFDGAWVFDHFKPLYGDPSGPCLEGWTLLAALAQATQRIRLGTLVTGITYRHPSVLTAEAVTVDHVSHGRLELGVGAAWFQEEHEQLGIDFPKASERVRRLDEAIEVMTSLMGRGGATFRGRYYRLDDADYNPKPVQQPHPPLWIGAGGEKLMLPLVGRRADVWHSFGSIELLEKRSAIVDRSAEEAGRDPSSIARATALSLSDDLDVVRKRIEQLAGIGIGYLTVSWPSEGQGRLDEFVEKVMPGLSDL